MIGESTLFFTIYSCGPTASPKQRRFALLLSGGIFLSREQMRDVLRVAFTIGVAWKIACGGPAAHSSPSIDLLLLATTFGSYEICSFYFGVRRRFLMDHPH